MDTYEITAALCAAAKTEYSTDLEELLYYISTAAENELNPDFWRAGLDIIRKACGGED